jgi:tetratricopeptide (TPR) repeat protein
LLLGALQREVALYVDREIAPQVAQLEQSIRTGGGNPPTHNKLGILYARYGRYEQAETEFRSAVERQEYVPALVNLGNLFLLQSQAERALEFYERAAEAKPQDPRVLLSLARIYHELEQYEPARVKYEELAAVDQPLADRYAYLGGAADKSSRAAATDNVRRQILWAE